MALFPNLADLIKSDKLQVENHSFFSRKAYFFEALLCIASL